MARAWIIDSRGLAIKVKNASLPAANQIKDCGAKRECPNCEFIIDNKEICNDWPGFPAGVKFDPTDLELIEHLAAKCGVGDSKPHMFIEEFIPTLDENEGICFTHPENLPGAKKDGSNIHFFNQIKNAYATGKRKRRKIETQNVTEQIRWHKTGKTKPVMDNGIQKGFKKIMVLYGTSKKGSKPDKSNWVMHQYHLGNYADEKEGEYVVSKIFYQQQKVNEIDGKTKEFDIGSVWTIPTTPMTVVPNQLRPVETPSFDDVEEIQSLLQEVEFVQDNSHSFKMESEINNEVENTWLTGGESQVTDSNGLESLDDLLWCKEIFDSGPSIVFSSEKTIDVVPSVSNVDRVIPDIENVELDTPPDFQLTDLVFDSQDSIIGWLDKLQ